MQEQNATLNNDPLLLPLLEATDPESSKRILGYLLRNTPSPSSRAFSGTNFAPISRASVKEFAERTSISKTFRQKSSCIFLHACRI